MTKPLDPKEIGVSQRFASRTERRNQKRKQMQEDIVRNQSGNGVVIIPPQKKMVTPAELPKLRVAAYCRVSTQEEQQVGSFDMQVLHFTKRIEGNPNWVLVEIYQDEGISATTVEKRLGFQKMIADAVDGKIDLILTKSISRFGRNIVDILRQHRTEQRRAIWPKKWYNLYMDKQITLSAFSDELANVRTEKKEFLAQIDRIVPWGEWVAEIKPCYYKGERGNKPYDLELMLRIYMLQNLYDRSDMGTVAEVIDSRAFSEFCGVDSSNQVPDGDSVTFTKKVLEDLGYPAYVLCMLDAKAKVFAIRMCKSNEPKGFKFSKPKGEQKGVVTISNKNLLDPLRSITGVEWIAGKRYKVRGFWVADAKTMCFDLNEGVQEDFRPVAQDDGAE